MWVGGAKASSGGGSGSGAAAAAAAAAAQEEEAEEDPVPRSVLLGVDRGLRERLDLPFHRMMNRESTQK